MSQTSKALPLNADPLIGHALGGKYVIKRLIGRGGVGLVYLADQLDVDREVVVKLLSPNWADDDEALARFEREARRLSGLKHPNIVTMLDFGKESRRAYLVMEYLQGELLADYVERQGRLTLEEFVPIAAQILKGIGHTHSREMMVRDIKPANIMLCVRKGRANFVKILDFGLAKLTRGEQAITEEHVMGTVGYLSPEQIRGDEIDLRVDVYALGVLFYYMLSGHLPFEGDNNATVFYKTINEPPPRLNEILPEDHDIPEGLIDLIHACLEKDRDQRPSNADEIVEGLIDVVPAAMFRLPRAETQRNDVPAPMPPGHGNTGMMELLGTDVSPSSRHSVDSGLMPAIAGPGSGLGRHTGQITPMHGMEARVGGESGPLPVHTGAHTGMHTGMSQAPGRNNVLLLVAIVLLAILGGGAAVWLMTNQGKQDEGSNVASVAPAGPAAVGAPAPRAEVDPKVVEAALTQADRLISESLFDEATTTLDEVRGLTQALPTLAGRIERADQKIAIGRLMAAGSKFEAEDKRDAATEAYRDALELDPSYLPAREALARLDVDAGPLPAGAEAVVFGEVSIDSKPSGAKIYIDGNPAGTTPFAGKLRVGDRQVRVVARGYYVWNESYSVKAADNVPMKVDLKGRGRGGKPSKGDEGDEVEEPTTKVDPKPDAKPSAGQTSGKTNPFLPTKKGDEPKPDEPEKKKPSGSPFLPTKD
jgi:eukaryotic-like serine/threonine-protein kinase